MLLVDLRHHPQQRLPHRRQTVPCLLRLEQRFLFWKCTHVEARVFYGTPATLWYIQGKTG